MQQFTTLNISRGTIREGVPTPEVEVTLKVPLPYHIYEIALGRVSPEEANRRIREWSAPYLEEWHVTCDSEA